MNPEVLAQLFSRDFETLENEIIEFSNPDNIWVKNSGINNSAGNLALHLAGNLEHFVGAILFSTGYVRDREFEFKGKVDREELIRRIRSARKSVQQTLISLSIEDFKTTYPLQPFGFEMTIEHFLIHLYGHFSYHLGQINYHRRLIDC